MTTKIFKTHSSKETMALAGRIAARLKPGDCLALTGDLGSGKTTFVKGLAQGLGYRRKGSVCSPTFVILKIYPSRIPLYHFDVYRLTSPDDFFRAGLEEFLQTDGVSVVEWADKVEQALPGTCLRITFEFEGSKGRLIKVRSPRGRDFLGTGNGKRRAS